MSVLKPYIDNGTLVVQSKQMGMDKVSTMRWDAATAQARMDNLLSAFYTKNHVDAVLSPYDGLSIGIISALKGVGYGTKELPMPVISGQDAEVPSVKSIINHEQYSTVFKDARAGQGRGRHGRRDARRWHGRGQRHQDLQQRRQGGAVLPVEAGRSRPQQL
jgi:putative multiple sugar transport system substrate-binding protein